MDGKFTKGPWAVHQRPTKPHEYGYHVTTEDGLQVCAVTYQLPDEYGETARIANARLIAAAPDLLEALVIARDYSAYAQAEPEDMAMIDAAIAKATQAREVEKR